MSKSNIGISKEDLHLYDIALRFCGFTTTPENLERLILHFNGVRKHKGAFSIKHIAKINAFIEEKYCIQPPLDKEEEKEDKSGDEDIDKDEDPQPTTGPWDLHKGD